MNSSQANRARIAQRASARSPRITLPAHLRPVSTGPMAPGPSRKSTAVPMTGAQRDSRGKRSDWSRSAEIGGSVGLIIRDSKWSASASNKNV